MYIHSTSGLPITTPCTIWNSMCQGGNLISGQVFLDANDDGVFNGADQPISGRTVRVTPGPVFTSSGENGLFELPVHAGSFELFADAGMYDVPAGEPIPISFNDVGLTSTGNALPMSAATPVADLAVGMVTTPAAPGFMNEVWIAITDQGTLPLGGALSFTLDAAQEWVTSNPPATVSGNTASWTLPILQLGERHTIAVTLATPTGVALGTELLHVAVVTASPADDMPMNDVALVTDTMVGSFDPNDKQASPQTLSLRDLAEGGGITYTVRFQNTRTWRAENIRIEDELPDDLEPSSFRMLGSSHPCHWSLTEGKLKVYFQGSCSRTVAAMDRRAMVSFGSNYVRPRRSQQAPRYRTRRPSSSIITRR
ncbi:MAG: hypothetical protein QM724_01970 [Flavobacteriales bacterium]